MLLAYAATARQHRRAAAVTAVILVVGPLKNVCPLVALVGAAVNREFRFANRPRFSFSFIKGNSQEHLANWFLDYKRKCFALSKRLHEGEPERWANPDAEVFALLNLGMAA